MKVLRKRIKDSPDLLIVHEIGDLVAVQDYVPKPILPNYPVVEPVCWYMLAELLYHFELEESDN